MKRPAFFLFSCLVFLLISVSTLSAQDTTYFDANWNRTVKSRASFYHLETKSGNLVSFTDYWMSNDQKQNEGQYLNGKETGLWVWWFKTGQKDWEVTYVNGQKEGTQTHWYPSGKLKKKIGYTADKTDGPCIWWYENGNRELETTYKMGFFDGTRTTWYPNGMLKLQEEYSEGKPIGEVVEYDETGKETMRRKLDDEVHFGEIDEGEVEEVVEEEPDPKRAYFYDKYPTPLNYSEISGRVPYPKEAIEKGLEGKVIVRVLVDKEGSVKKHMVVRGVDPLLDQAVVELLPELRFEPAEEAGKKVLAWVSLPFDFKLSNVKGAGKD